MKDESFLYVAYIYKAKTILKIISIEIMREVSELDITQTYFTPATTAVSLRILVYYFILFYFIFFSFFFSKFLFFFYSN